MDLIPCLDDNPNLFLNGPVTEYGYTLKVDEKIDIYSFRVVLLELLTGKRPLDPEFGESSNIVEWTRRKVGDNKALEEALDPNLGNFKHMQEEMLLVVRIALLCTAKHPKDRPSMRDVITMLGEAEPRRKSSSNSGGNALTKEMPVFSTSPVKCLYFYLALYLLKVCNHWFILFRVSTGIPMD
ncbi:hypothetical protein V6N13_045176 [Hibiscus sabdariffa]|uniref:Protein kinase domain-containing protein n=1 Tax=Hibiscus sabdariffa TaxID=183260 RepID=A0ABR2RKQ9_9ROSI